MNISIAKNYSYPDFSNLSQEILEQKFKLLKEEKEFVNAREKHNRLGFAVLMKTFSFLGYFVTDLNKVPISMVTHLAVQLSLEPDTVKRYNKLTSVKKYHVQLIKKYYGINLFDAECKKLLYDWLLQQYRITSDHNNIVKGCIQKIRNEHWELPAISYIESIVNDALESTNQEFYTHFEKVLSSKQKSMINELVRPLQEKQKKSELSLLKLIPGKPTIITLNAQIKLYNKLKEFEIGKDIMKNISVQKIESFAHQGKKYNIKILRGFSASKRHAIISCFIYKNMKDTFDNIVHTLIKKVRVIHNKADKKFRENLGRYSENTKKNMKDYNILSNKISKSYDEPKILHKEIITFKTKEEFEKVIVETSQYVYERSDTYRYLLGELSSLRRFSQRVLKIAQLSCEPEHMHLLEMVELVRKKWKNKNTKVRITEEFKKSIESKWHEYIFPENKDFDWRYFEIYVISTAATALKSGDLWIEGSSEYGSLQEHLLSDEDWEKIKPEFLKELKLPFDYEKIIQRFNTNLDEALTRFNKGIKGNRYVNTNDGKLRISPLDRADVPKYIPSLKYKILDYIGDVNLTDMLIDVQLQTNFCSNFRHMGGWIKNISQTSNERLLGALHSLGCNLGPAQTSKSTKFGEMQIINARNAYLSERNLRNANNQIVNLFMQLRMAKIWGDATSVSADGRQITISSKNLLASWNAKYHSTGGMLYTHVSDMYIAIYSQLIDCGVYEAQFILDPIFNVDNKIEIKPNKLHADTHGQTELMFGFCTLLGIKLMPRMKNISQYELYKPDASSDYNSIEEIIDGKIDWSKIYVALDQMLRLCASIRYGLVRSSLILKKLTSYRKANRIYDGFRELGKAARTIYIFEYASSKELRRMVQLACNKSEMWHNFQKFMYFGQSGELRINDLAEQKESTTALELVCNIAAYWNAVKIKEAVQHLKEKGENFKDEDIKFITPLITSHINRFGRFDFDIEKRKKQINDSS